MSSINMWLVLFPDNMIAKSVKITEIAPILRMYAYQTNDSRLDAISETNQYAFGCEVRRQNGHANTSGVSINVAEHHTRIFLGHVIFVYS